MVIVESNPAFETFIEKFQRRHSIVIPVLTDAQAHPAVNRLAFLYAYFPMDGDTFILPFDHPDCDNLSADYLDRLDAYPTCHVPFKKSALHVWKGAENATDLTGKEYFYQHTVKAPEDFYPTAMRMLHGKFSQYTDVNQSVPLMVLVAFCDAYRAYLEPFYHLVTEDGFVFHNTIVVQATQFMEASGIHVDELAFIDKFGSKAQRLIHHGLVYGEYSLYSTTGRASVKHGGISFSSLNKHDGTRACFTSRFDNGMMLLIDYESFHLRLIANLIGYELPAEPVHEYFGKQYFQTDVLTPEQYEESKKKTFAALYGENRDVDLPFFKQVYAFIDSTWHGAQRKGYYQSRSGRKIWLKHMEAPNPAKLFNYILQLEELEETMMAIWMMRETFADKRSKIVLYTYDSLLIDFSKDDGADLIKQIVTVMERGGKFPVRVYVGDDYHTLKNVTQVVKNSCI